MGTNYLIKWQNPDAKGSTDIIDSDWFSPGYAGKSLSHATLVGRTVLTSVFDIESDGEIVLFRYGGKHAAANKKVGIYRGDMRILPKEFPDTKKLGWRDFEDDDFDMLPVQIEKLASQEGVKSQRQASHISRDASLAFYKRADAMARSGLKCEACAFDGHSAYGDAATKCFEVHHKRPVSENERITELDDLALICANCHNAIHGMKNITFEEFLARFQ